MKIIRFGIILIFLLSILSGAASAGLLVWPEHSAVKVRPFDPPGQATSVHLYSAKNEWEAVQVILTGDAGQALTGCDVVLDDFTGPATALFEPELFREHYVYISHPSAKPVDHQNIGYWPDALVPFTDHYFGEDRDGAPFDVEAGWNQPIWIDIYTPATQEPGDYTSTVTVSCSGETPVQIPLVLTVWDFELPNSISLPSSYGYSCSQVYSTHQSMGGTAEKKALTQMYYEEALRHRMMLAWGHCVSPGWTYEPSTQTVTFDFTEFDANMGPVLDGTLYKPGASFDTFAIPRSGGPDEQIIAYWRGFAEEFDSRGWFDKLFLYMLDEPRPDEYDILIADAAKLHEANPNLKAMATEQVTDALKGSVDIWCPDEPLFSDSLPWPPFPQDYPPRQALGEQVWWYNCMSAQYIVHYSTHFVDDVGMSMRIWPWLTRRYNFNGVLFWSATWLYGAVSDVWEDVYAKQFFCNGDGQMFYPGVTAKIGGTNDIPIAAMRLKLLREGMEDYEYFRLLDNMGQEAFVQTEVESKAPTTYQWEKDPGQIEMTRHRVASMILGTLDIDPPAAPTGLSATPGSLSLVLNWTPNTEPDIFGYEISFSRYPGERIAAATVDDLTTQVAFEGLEQGKPYYMTVRTIDESTNKSPWAAEISAMPEEPGDDDDDDDNNDDNNDNDNNDNDNNDNDDAAPTPVPCPKDEEEEEGEQCG